MSRRKQQELAVDEVKCAKSGKNRVTLDAKAKRFSAKKKGRKSDVTSAVLALVYTCTCIQCVKVLAPNLPHERFFPLGLCF